MGRGRPKKIKETQNIANPPAENADSVYIATEDLYIYRGLTPIFTKGKKYFQVPREVFGDMVQGLLLYNNDNEPHILGRWKEHFKVQ